MDNLPRHSAAGRPQEQWEFFDVTALAQRPTSSAPSDCCSLSQSLWLMNLEIPSGSSWRAIGHRQPRQTSLRLALSLAVQRRPGSCSTCGRRPEWQPAQVFVVGGLAHHPRVFRREYLHRSIDLRAEAVMRSMPGGRNRQKCASRSECIVPSQCR